MRPQTTVRTVLSLLLATVLLGACQAADDVADDDAEALSTATEEPADPPDDTEEPTEESEPASTPDEAETTEAAADGEATTWVVGAPISLTGDTAFAGTAAQNGMELALQDIEAEGLLGDDTIEIRYEDDASDETEHATVLRALINDDSVIAVAGGMASNLVAPNVGTAQEAGIVYGILNAFTPGLAEEGDYVFQISQPTAPFQAAVIEYVAEEHQPEAAAILYAQDVPTTVAFRDDFIAGLEEAGIPLVVDEAMSIDDVDHSAQLSRAQDAGADLLITNFFGPINASVAVQAQQMGYEPVIVGHVGNITPQYFEVGGDAVVGSYSTTAFTAGAPTVEEFTAAYREQFDTDPDINAAEGYQAIRMFAEALATAPADRASFRDALMQVGAVQSVLGSSGTAEFDDSGVLTYDGVIVRTAADGSFQPVDS